MTVGQLRKAIEGLPDDSPVLLDESYHNDAAEVDMTLESVQVQEKALVLNLAFRIPEADLDGCQAGAEFRCDSCDDDDWDDDWDDDRDSYCEDP